MKDNGIMTNNMDLELRFGLMVDPIRDFIMKDKNMEKFYSLGKYTWPDG